MLVVVLAVVVQRDAAERAEEVRVGWRDVQPVVAPAEPRRPGHLWLDARRCVLPLEVQRCGLLHLPEVHRVGAV